MCEYRRDGILKIPQSWRFEQMLLPVQSGYTAFKALGGRELVDNVIIMAGGAGKRLWPASMGKRPKQFLKVDGDISLFKGTLDRAFNLGISGLVYVVTHENHVDAAVAECINLDPSRRSRVIILAEPIARNTAPALALAAARMELDGRSDQTAIVMAADHLISPMAAFTASVEAASLEAESDFIVPYGIIPRDPATGYGYIEAGEKVGEGYEVISFREKPDAETARDYLDSGRYYWNAGLFTYRSSVFSGELDMYAPDISSVFSDPSEAWFSSKEIEGLIVYQPSESLRQLYAACPGRSVDYAVMEKTEKIRMIAASFDWNDVGSWDVIADLDTPNPEPVYSHQSSGNFVYSDRPVALCGVEDLIVVVANDRVMICRKGMSQLVKNAAEEDLAEK